MTTVYQRDSDIREYHIIKTVMPVRSCGRFVVREDRNGQWPVEYGFMLDGEVLVWTRPESQAERVARESEIARIEERNYAAYQAYLVACKAWEGGAYAGPEPEYPEPEQSPWDGRVVRDVQAALLARGIRGLSTDDWNQVRVLDSTQEREET